MRAELIERAEAMLKSRHIKSPFDVSHDELPSLLADFALEMLKEFGKIESVESVADNNILDLTKSNN